MQPLHKQPAKNRPGSHRYHLDLLLFGLFCLILSAAFIWQHLSTPSDGARLSRGQQLFTPDGVVVSPYHRGEGQLQEGDIVSAVEGVSIETWAQGLIRRGLDRPDWQVGQTVRYRVVRDGQTITLPIQLTPLPLWAILRDHWSVLLFFVAAQALAVFVYFQSHEDPAAKAFFAWAFSGSHTYIWAFFLQTSDLVYPAGFWLFHLGASGLWLIFWAASVHMTLVFPKDLLHLPGRWLVGLYLSPVVLFILFLAWQWQTRDNLLVWLESWGTGQILVGILYTIPSLILILIQYLTSRSEVERLKTRWVIFGTLVSGSLGLMLYFLPSLIGKSPISANTLGLIMFPFIITMTIAIWRYQLFDIDLIIRRTLQYSLLTGLLSLLYFSGVALLQGILSPEGNQTSPFVIVVTTLAIAALFNPLRQRIQAFIDRRFYRQKYDAEKALAEFADAARSETDLAQLSSRLKRTVQETLHPEHTTLWLIEPHVKSKQVEE